jgi:CHASE3 domain sensor protein
LQAKPLLFAAMNEKKFNLLRWAPVVASVVLMLAIIVVAVASVAELKKATNWRDHTFQAILDAQTFEDKLVDAQDSVRDYAGKGQANLLIEYRRDTNIDLQEFNQLTQLTLNDPEQEKRLKNLAAAIKDVFADDGQIIGIYARQGSNAAVRADETDQSTTGVAIDDLAKFTDDEEGLLTKQDATEQKDYHRATRTLIYASMVIAGLLILANIFASREMARRRKAESEQSETIAQLQKALGQVKTLSGLVPICGWCKKVRNDTGFWQSVEQYVGSRTDATFSHGMCPECAEKFKTEILKANFAADDLVPKI